MINGSYPFDDTSLLSVFLRFFLKWCVPDGQNNILNEDIQVAKMEATLIGFDVKYPPRH